MCDSGLAGVSARRRATLRDGMREAARLGLPVAVHAEDEDMTRRLSAVNGGASARAFLASRPVAAEVEAIAQRARHCRSRPAPDSTSCMSAPAAASRWPRRPGDRGVDVSVETCPHYLFFTDEDLERIGVVAKCAPPLAPCGRTGAASGASCSTGASTSSHPIIRPSDPSLKKAGDFRTSWGGIAGVQSTLAVLLERGFDGRRLRFERVASLIAGNPAARFSIPGKGSLSVGNDADLMLLDPSRSYTLDARQAAPTA